MTREHWISVLDQSAACGVSRVQLIGGEPTLCPEAPGLVAHARKLPGMTLATSTAFAPSAAPRTAPREPNAECSPGYPGSSCGPRN